MRPIWLFWNWLTLSNVLGQVSDTDLSPVQYICGLVAYDGTAYHGFQYQRDVSTIQGELERALCTLTKTDVRVIGSGRTDTGVHARGQVIAARVPWRHSVEALQRAWNVNLPDDIVVRRLQLAPTGFHARFSALGRTYRYAVYQFASSRDEAQRSPLTDRFAFYITKPLDLLAMNAAAEYLVGEHDFATFGQPPEGENTVRQVYDAAWQVVRSDLPTIMSYPGVLFVFTIKANAFLYQMVRNLVGSLLEVGYGRWRPEDVKSALVACDRKRSAPPAPPCGLTLEQVEYPNHLGLVF
jgi:tRNA pseudouridine38-40 synthase